MIRCMHSKLWAVELGEDDLASSRMLHVRMLSCGFSFDLCVGHY